MVMQYLGLIMSFKNVMSTNMGVLHIEFGLLERETNSGSYSEFLAKHEMEREM